MKNRRLILSFLMSALFFQFVTPQSATAHPHGWVDLKSAPIFNDDGFIIGLKQEWLFDDFYSAFILEDIDLSEDIETTNNQLNSLAKENLKNLAEYNYFNDIRADNKPVTLQEVTQYQARLEGFRLSMDFTVGFATPIDPKSQSFQYAIYDPTYYIEILHSENTQAIQTIGKASQSCKSNLIPPNPSEDLMIKMAALDQNQTAGTEIGVHFAEKVVITCD